MMVYVYLYSLKDFVVIIIMNNTLDNTLDCRHQ